jgi:hypothetical protein
MPRETLIFARVIDSEISVADNWTAQPFHRKWLETAGSNIYMKVDNGECLV